MGKTTHRSNLGVALALGIFSHIVLDIIHHEPNIAILPMAWGPLLGLNLQGSPLLDFVVELAFCVACWKIFQGSRGLLLGIIIFNLLNIPLMFPRAGSIMPLVEHPMILPTVILVQVAATWLFVWWFGRRTIYLGDTPREHCRGHSARSSDSSGVSAHAASRASRLARTLCTRKIRAPAKNATTLTPTVVMSRSSFVVN